jgi:hypothetical protein
MSKIADRWVAFTCIKNMWQGLNSAIKWLKRLQRMENQKSILVVDHVHVRGDIDCVVARLLL